MRLFSFWRSTRHTTSAGAPKRYWLFYAGPENYLFEGGACDLPRETFWSCERETKRGDLILVYRKSMDQLSVSYLVRQFGMSEDVAKRLKKTRIGKDFPVIWEATSDAKRTMFWHWTYGCNTKEVQRINPPLLLEALKAKQQLKKWEGLRWNLQARGRSALEIPEFAWNSINNLIQGPAS